jgi:trehalose/maltose hydrolase-like predicted phosphorylase
VSRGPERLPAALARRFEAVLFDWDGTAVPDRRADASAVRDAVERLCAAGVEVGVVSGTHVDNVDGQLRARPPGPGSLHLLLNRGSEVIRVGAGGPELVSRRAATPEEDEALTAAASLAVERLGACGLEARLVAQRLNRRKLDLIPEPAWADPPKARIGELLAAVDRRLQGAGLGSLAEAARLVLDAARESGLEDARVTSDAKHVEVGLTDKSDSARWFVEHLWGRGIAPGELLVAGDEFGPLGGLPGSDANLLAGAAVRAVAVSVGAEPAGVPAGVVRLGGGSQAFVGLLHDQLVRRAQRELPGGATEPGWFLAVEGMERTRERAREALLTQADGVIGMRGSLPVRHPGSSRGVLAAGVYRGSGDATSLLPCPRPAPLPCDAVPGGRARRVLDLHTGVLHHAVETDAGPVEAVSFASLASPGTVLLRYEAPSRVVAAARPLEPAPRTEPEEGCEAGAVWARASGTPGGVAVAAADEPLLRNPLPARLDRALAYAVAADRRPTAADALARLAAARAEGFDRLLAEHRTAWALRWEDSDVLVDGDGELQLAVRFALFHLIASVADAGEAAVGARGLSGTGYRGHVFWDADVFVLPFLAATHPEAARAMLEYRARRLPAALEAARRAGRRGARFPWESAASGEDVTPEFARTRGGRVVPIRTGQLEEHVVADVAWAVSCYLDWSGDEEFACGIGRDLLVETARYWASRACMGEDGRAHLYGVIGPDEYHGPVDDNAYTNVMARWNLRRALAATADGGVPQAERDAWHRLAELLVDGYDPATGLYEQFTGFFALEPLVVADLAPRRPVAAPLLLGEERVAGAQVVKQADVLMLHHLIPDEVAPSSLEPNLRFYEPRTAHGSSLSPPIHAALLARAGMERQALDALRLAARVDLDDLTQTTAAGLHLACMGGVWQALVYGFLGARPAGSALRLDPRLPASWSGLEVRLRFAGSRIRIRCERERLRLRADPATAIALVGEATPFAVGPEGVELRRGEHGWRRENA